jgi:hypothetical protein
MRRDPTYTAFQRRWQLPVYFQLRWKEIVVSLEDVLSVERLEPNLKSTSSHDFSSGTSLMTRKESDSFATPQATAVWIAVSACWSSEIYIPELCYKFWRLSLQVCLQIFISIEDPYCSLSRF